MARLSPLSAAFLSAAFYGVFLAAAGAFAAHRENKLASAAGAASAAVASVAAYRERKVALAR